MLGIAAITELTADTKLGARDTVMQRAMRHSSPETKRHYQLGMVDQVREGIERADEKPIKAKKSYVLTTVGSNRRKELHRRL